MSASKNFPKGSIFGLQDGMTQAQIKALEWMYNVKTTTKSNLANLNSFWENGSMMYKSTKSLRRGDKFILLEEDAKKEESDNESEDSDNEKSDNKRNSSSKRRSRTRANKSNDTSVENDDDDSYKGEEEESAKDSDFESEPSNRRSKRRKLNSRNKSYDELSSENQKDENVDSDEDRDSNVSDGDTFTCNTCSKVFSNAPALKEHVKKHGPGIKMHSCDFCDRSFVYVTSLEAHMKDNHKGKSRKEVEEKHKKNEKKKSKKDEDEKIEKTAKKIDKKMFKCDECGKEFSWETSYEDHMAVHRKDFLCKLCKKVFGKKIYLENHMMSHKNDKEKKKATIDEYSSGEESQPSRKRQRRGPGRKKKNGKNEKITSETDEELMELSDVRKKTKMRVKREGKKNMSESEDEVSFEELGRGKRKRKVVSPRSPPGRVSSRSSAKKINYALMDEGSEEEEEFELKSKEREKIELERHQIRSCCVKLHRICVDNAEKEVDHDDDDLHRCTKCETVYKDERLWLNHMKKFHS